MPQETLCVNVQDLDQSNPSCLQRRYHPLDSPRNLFNNRSVATQEYHHQDEHQHLCDQKEALLVIVFTTRS